MGPGTGCMEVSLSLSSTTSPDAKKISVIGLLMDYDSGHVVKVLKTVSDYTRGTTQILEADSNEHIDKMLARINALFTCTK